MKFKFKERNKKRPISIVCRLRRTPWQEFGLCKPNLLCKSMDWLLYGRNPRHELVNHNRYLYYFTINSVCSIKFKK